VNDRIRVPQVRVIAVDGSQAGIMDTRDAIALARQMGLDLVEVSPTARPPVCRVMDFGKYKYEQSKKTQKAKKKTHVMQQKEVKLRPKIEEHDVQFKLKHAREFLEGHDRVKLTVTFRGRELAHSEMGHKLLERIVTELSDVGQIETSPRMEGRAMIAVMVPRSNRAKAPETASTGAGE
jgi:translation initiation factor IF-3